VAGVARSLRTARLTLRPPTPEDAPAIAASMGNYDVVRWLAAPPYPYVRADAERFIAETRAGSAPVWAIDDSDGLCGLIGVDPDLGYWLDRRAWGRGYATEAGDAVIDAWFAGSGAQALRASHMQGNDRSRAALLRMGFRDDGPREIWSTPLSQMMPARDLVMSRTDWAASRRYRLRTPRLRLRELRDGDVPALARIGGDARVAPMIWGATSPWPEDAAHRWVQAWKYRGRPGFRAAICTRLGRLIGTIMVAPNDTAGEGTTAWFIDPDYWGRGLCTEAAGAFLPDVMDRFGLRTLVADHFADNPASGAVMRKLGFQQTGQGLGRSSARLEPAPVILYRLERATLKVSP